MKSLGAGYTTVRTVRIPDPLWTRLTDWAQRAGVGDSEALRQLLRVGLDPEQSVQVRPPLPWMRNGLVYARVPQGRDWWDLDDLLGHLPGALRHEGPRRRSSEVWWSLPPEQLSNARSLFAARPDRISLHAFSDAG